MEVAGVEFSSRVSQGSDYQLDGKTVVDRWTQIWTQISGKDRQDLSKLVECWPSLAPELQAAIVAIVDASRRKGREAVP